MLFDNRIGRFSSDSQAIVLRGQATKGERWMPWRQEATKGVASCDKPRGAASRHRSGDARMGKPGRGNARSSEPESIGLGSEPGELKHLSTSRKRKKTRLPEWRGAKGEQPNRGGGTPPRCCGAFIGDPRRVTKWGNSRRPWNGPPQKVKAL